MVQDVIGRRTEHLALFSKSGFAKSLAPLAKSGAVELYDLPALEKLLA